VEPRRPAISAAVVAEEEDGPERGWGRSERGLEAEEEGSGREEEVGGEREKRWAVSAEGRTRRDGLGGGGRRLSRMCYRKRGKRSVEVRASRRPSRKERRREGGAEVTSGKVRITRSNLLCYEISQ